jgi:protein TonB
VKTESPYFQGWNEIIFEKRNKDYGAYIIRSLYNRHVITGLIASIVVIAISIGIPKIMLYFRHKQIDGAFDVQNSTYTKLTQPPPIDKNSQVTIMERPTVNVAVKNLPPVVVTEEVMQEEVPTVEQIKETTPNPPTETVSDQPGETLLTGDGGNGEIFNGAEQMPHFIGGEPAMVDFISKNLRYPLSAQRMRLSGTVFVSFIVNTDGSIDEVRATNGISADCDKEAVRVVQIMPYWEPGRQEGKPVRVRFIIPIRFKFGK